jgi:hypothetical protein
MFLIVLLQTRMCCFMPVCSEAAACLYCVFVFCVLSFLFGG